MNTIESGGIVKPAVDLLCASLRGALLEEIKNTMAIAYVVVFTCFPR